MFKWKDWDTPMKGGFTLQDDQNPYKSCEPSWPVLLTCFKDPLCRLYMFALLQWSPSVLLKTSLSRYVTGKTRLTKVSGMRSLLVAPGGRWALWDLHIILKHQKHLEVWKSGSHPEVNCICRFPFSVFFCLRMTGGNCWGPNEVRTIFFSFCVFVFAGFVGLWGGSDGPIFFTPFLYIHHSPYTSSYTNIEVSLLTYPRRILLVPYLILLGSIQNTGDRRMRF